MTTDITGILEDVVQQFSDPFAFFRELVQNAIDAGTGEIEIDVSLEHVDDETQTGLAVASVQDFGCGMTREIIETQLCRLFSSAKYGDFTKIGRFGIGFVSVYGIEPDWVCVDTGRDGQSWRVIFLPDRSFELRDLRDPVEGTRVRVARRMAVAEFETFRQRSLEVVRRWCQHVRIPVRFDGHDLRQPFDIDSPCVVEFEEEGTRVVAALVGERAPACAYYNRGLLLQERAQSPWPHVAFKIDSRMLEHTLTRDDLLHDRGYHRAVELLEELATKTLPNQLLADLEAEAGREPSPRRTRLLQLLGRLGSSGILTSWRRRKLLPGVDGPRSARSCEAAEVVYATREASNLAIAVTRAGHIVLLGDPDDLAPLVRTRVERLEDELLLLDAQPWSTDDAAVGLAPVLNAFLASRGVRPGRLWLGSWDGACAVVVDDPLGPQWRRSLRPPIFEELDAAPLVLNTRDDVVGEALRLAQTDPTLACVLLLARISPAACAEAAVWSLR